MTDLDTLARRAGSAAREEARSRSAGMAVPGAASGRVGVRSRRPATRVLVAVGVAAAVLAVVVVVRLLPEPGLVIDPVAPDAGDGLLELPEVGSAEPGFLVDGSPVFVSRPDEDTVLVLDAVVPHLDNKLVAFCESSGWFEDLYHGSRFSGWGDWIGGPSPTGLPDYPHEVVDTPDGPRVHVTGPVGAAPARSDPLGPQTDPRGPACDPDDGGDLTGAVVHRPPSQPRALDAAAVPADRWVWATLVVGGSYGDVRVCDADGTCPADAPAAGPDLSLSAPPGLLLDRAPAVWLARSEPDGSITLRRPADPADHGLRRSDTDLLPVAPPGEALALDLRDGTPVFVVTDIEGTTLVLDATSTATPTSLVGWCPGEGEFTDATGARFGVTGASIDPEVGPDLRRHPAEVVELGETHAVRVTGVLAPVMAALPATAGTAPVEPCTGMVAHAPASNDFVHTEPTHPGSDTWAWMRRPVAIVDGEPVLCALDLACSDPDNPAIVTPGAAEVAWPDEAVLLLVRGPDEVEADEDGAPRDDMPRPTVEIRRLVGPASTLPDVAP